jgi:hypothetical protein
MRSPHDLAQRGVLQVVEPDPELLVGEEEVPEPCFPRQRLEFLDDRIDRPGAQLGRFAVNCSSFG